MQNLNEMRDSFFSLKPYKNRTEAVYCTTGYVAAAVALPFLLYAMWPIIAWPCIALVIVAIAAGASYQFNYMMDNHEHLKKYESTYQKINLVTIGFPLLNLIPPVICSAVLIAAVIFRAWGTWSVGFGQDNLENVAQPSHNL
jgi:hypothetical protein